MDKAIKLAIEKGGYKPHKNELTFNLSAFKKNNYKASNRTKSIFLLDPLFWQALGKALGWPFCPLRHHPHSVECHWPLRKAMKFFETKLTGGNEEAFWEDLINK